MADQTAAGRASLKFKEVRIRKIAARQVTFLVSHRRCLPQRRCRCVLDFDFDFDAAGTTTPGGVFV